MLLLAAMLAVVAHRAGATPGDRPTLEEWKENQRNETNKVEAKVAKQAKMAAVDKVISMLEGVKAKVMAEGEDEAKAYNKFACFCKDLIAQKTSAISSASDQKVALSADVQQLGSDRKTLDSTIATLLSNIQDAETAMQAAEAARQAESKEYQRNSADLTAAIFALESALQALKASKSSSLVQIKSISGTLRTASMLADALGFLGDAGKKEVDVFLQQAPDVPTKDFQFHSNGIIKTLEKLLADFILQKNVVDAAEVNSIAFFQALMQDKTDVVKQKSVQLADDKTLKSKKQAQIASNSEELSVASATLLDDQQYLSELSKICSNKAITWDQRSQVRQDELSALLQAIDILKTSVSEKTTASTVRFAQQAVSLRRARAVIRNEDAMEVVEAYTEEQEANDLLSVNFIQVKDKQAYSFLARARQHRAAHDSSPRQDYARQVIMRLLKNKGKEVHSALLTALANQIAADPFAKVKKLIQELIERLLEEASQSANHKNWCDKAISDATQKRDYAAAAVKEANGEMASLEARRDKLVEQLDILMREMAELKQKQAEAKRMRSVEAVENAKTVAEAKAGLEAVEQAIDILSKFYQTAAKSNMDLSLSQRGPADDAPDTGFEIAEAYTGLQGEAKGVIGMLDIIKSDFQRTSQETEKAEEQAQQDHLDFMTQTGKSLAEKQTAQTQSTAEKTSAEDELSSTDDELKSQLASLNTSLKELLELQPACVDTGMSYAERVARREAETQALQKALCILKAYTTYGPDGAADKC